VLHGSNIREALMAANAILVAEGYPPITVVDGDREYEKQVAIFLARYVLVGQVNGRRVYDFRWWEGRQYARISPAGTVAAPSRTAPHVAKIAADLGYPYNDRNTAAHRRLQQIAPGLGLDWTGRFFGEDWHWETTRGVGRIDGGGTTASTSEEEDMGLTPEQDARLKDIENFIIGNMRNTSPQEGGIAQKINVIHDRVLGALPGAQNGRDQFPRVLDTGDGNYLVELIRAATLSPETVKTIVEAAFKQVSIPAPTIDYAAIAKRVNDEADKRARQRLAS
jgi:hypothetical protein